MIFAQNRLGETIRLTSNENYIVNKMYLDGNFTPIGWSRDGKIAYAVYLGMVGTGGFVNISKIVIFDMITDTELETISNRDSENNDVDFSEFWLISKNRITNMLRKYNIISFPEIEIQNMDTLRELYGLSIEYQEVNDSFTDFTVTNRNG
jgi:hypothetical protein